MTRCSGSSITPNNKCITVPRILNRWSFIDESDTQTEYTNCLIQTVGESPMVHHNSVFSSFPSMHSTGWTYSLCFIQGSFRSPEESISNEFVSHGQFSRSRSHGFSVGESTSGQPTLRSQKKPKYFEGVRKSLQRSRKLDSVVVLKSWVESRMNYQLTALQEHENIKEGKRRGEDSVSPFLGRIDVSIK